MVLVAVATSVVALVVAGTSLVRARTACRLVGQIAAAQHDRSDDVDWHLQWVEPGVYALTNTSTDVAAFDVEVTSVLTPADGAGVSSAVAREARVSPGAWIEVRHPGIGQALHDDLQQLRRSTALIEELRRRPESLDATHLALLTSTGDGIGVLQERVEHTLAYAVGWRSSGVARRSTPSKQRLVPSPTF